MAAVWDHWVVNDESNGQWSGSVSGARSGVRSGAMYASGPFHPCSLYGVVSLLFTNVV